MFSDIKNLLQFLSAYNIKKKFYSRHYRLYQVIQYRNIEWQKSEIFICIFKRILFPVIISILILHNSKFRQQ